MQVRVLPGAPFRFRAETSLRLSASHVKTVLRKRAHAFTPPENVCDDLRRGEGRRRHISVPCKAVVTPVPESETGRFPGDGGDADDGFGERGSDCRRRGGWPALRPPPNGFPAPAAPREFKVVAVHGLVQAVLVGGIPDPSRASTGVTRVPPHDGTVQPSNLAVAWAKRLDSSSWGGSVAGHGWDSWYGDRWHR